MAIYVDNGATSWPKPESVYLAVNHYMRTNGASPGRGNYARAMEADRLVYRTRKALCKLLGAKRPSQISLCANATEAVNIALKGFLEQGDRVLCTPFEHNAMWRPLKMLEKDRDIRLDTIPADKDGELDLQWLERELRDGVRMVAVTHGSNVIGCVTPLAEIVAMAHRYGATALVDAAQTAGAYPIDVTALGVDMLAFTGHKALLGPTGTGGLYLAEGIKLHTLKEGGTGGMSASPFPPEDPPDRYEAGTMNIAGIAGLFAAVEFLTEIGVDAVRRHELTLMHALLRELEEIPTLTFYGPAEADKRIGLVSLILEGKDPYQVAKTLDEDYGVMVRAGIHCAPQAHRLLGTEQNGLVRVSVSYFNTLEEMRILAEALGKMAKGE